MNYFYILITKKENLEILEDTIKLIKEYCLQDSNDYSVSIDRKEHSNCLLDKYTSHIQVYDSKKVNFESYKNFYLSKYNLKPEDINILFKVYSLINIEKIESLKVQVKVTYNFSLINALDFIINLLGSNEALNIYFNDSNGEIFNQVITNQSEVDCAIVENNHIYNAIFENGSYKKLNKLEKNEIFQKYGHYKKLNNQFGIKNKKELNKI